MTRAARALLIWQAIWVVVLAAPPVVYHTDLVSGPAVPANGGTGALVTIYGKNFGSSKGASTVTLGTTAVTVFPRWTDTKVTIEVPASLANGVYAIVVTVGGVASNSSVSFTVAGNGTRNIKYLDAGDKTGASGDSCSSPRTGTLASPYRWYDIDRSTRSISYYAKTCLSNEDILYVRAGTIDREDSRGWYAVLSLDWAGAARHIIAYPGETVTLDADAAGDPSPALNQTRNAVRTVATGSTGTVAGFTLVGGSYLNTGSTNVGCQAQANGRCVGNVLRGPNTCQYEAGSVGTGGVFLSNEITDVGTNCNSGAGPNKLMHSMYVHCALSSPSHDFEIGWNYIHGNKTYNGIQLHDDSADEVGGCYNASIHDNRIDGQHGNGINLSTIDWPTGSETMRIYNNTISRSGYVALAYGESAGPIKACIAVKGFGRNAATGTIDVYNNTLIDCVYGLANDETYGNVSTAGVVYISNDQAGATLRLRNNVIWLPTYYWTTSQNWYAAGSGTAQITGSDNIWYGDTDSDPPAGTGTETDPLMTNAAGGDYTLTASSSARDAGVTITPQSLTDAAGLPRISNTSIDIGAYEYQVTVYLPGGRQPVTGKTTITGKAVVK
jgi:hypothetical protein